jgi:hypothetical protein
MRGAKNSAAEIVIFRRTPVDRPERARVPTYAMVSASFVPSFAEIVDYELQGEEEHSRQHDRTSCVKRDHFTGMATLYIDAWGPERLRRSDYSGITFARLFFAVFVQSAHS